MITIGVIGGSGLYEIEGLIDKSSVKVDTPFGDPSDDFLTGALDGKDVVFLPRHGKGHATLPGELNHHANIYGMKKLGVTHIISVSAVGSLKEEIKPLDIVIPDQFIDRSEAKGTTFFGDGIVAHIGFSDPICPSMSDVLFEAAKAAGATTHKGGTYVNMEGPAFSTRAESNLYRSWGMDIIGMTNMPEARLAREAEICYATAALITDYDCWYVSEDPVTVEIIMDNIRKNEDMSKKIVREAISRIGEDRSCGCGSALAGAIVTDMAIIPDEVKERLRVIAGKYLK